ncbi:sigma-70 family RNA polymerase sigma factor [Acutalibacter muris]|uniref:sigma-70 family RNA polymerase sigma factor n=2 Tax=Acutalibacter muris TaxID=1796620 RepID=UPI001FAEC90C|nr:sigma-70 family RNA polymerase sigma factor [Acutalibacter muris]
MKEINLRDYYPFYTKDTVVEVPDEVADLLREYKLSEAAHFLRTYRHKAYFSLDYDKNVERDALVIMLAPEDVLVQEEEHARLYRAISLFSTPSRVPIYFTRFVADRFGEFRIYLLVTIIFAIISRPHSATR